MGPMVHGHSGEIEMTGGEILVAIIVANMILGLFM